MVEIHINNHAGVARKNIIEFVATVQNHGVRIGEVVDKSVQGKSLSNFITKMSVARVVEAAFGKITHEVSDQNLLVVARQRKVRQIIQSTVWGLYCCTSTPNVCKKTTPSSVGMPL